MICLTVSSESLPWALTASFPRITMSWVIPSPNMAFIAFCCASAAAVCSGVAPAAGLASNVHFNCVISRSLYLMASDLTCIGMPMFR